MQIQPIYLSMNTLVAGRLFRIPEYLQPLDVV